MKRADIAFAAVGMVLLAGCSQASAAHAVTGCSSAAPGTVTVTAAVLDGRADPAPHRVAVPLGGTVQVQISADRVRQVHIHGYDLEYDAAPGTPGCVSFTADRAGLFDVEAHPDTLLVQLEVR
ncbi:hypothetical protein BJ973_001277 [Actinoplanes tereljensis]|uniref:EfeO-type cupredoxin-like domain-containing protein n=1 Tax=Paractinoplanes tereljensis TaxID=571912 RepID=A0A919NNI6_9ACTN|nr:hypothetical protein [Actinoplanes tereljensis]GIF20817.1 hypothetical protein Ate02nite_35470 [Actinoplanes tereljensis]